MESSKTMGIKAYRVKVGGEGGIFFVETAEGPKSYSATWTANTSYGLYGYYWGSMGSPFGKFIQGADPGYVLSKISTPVQNSAVFKRSLLSWLERSELSPKDKSKAADYVERLARMHDGDELIQVTVNSKSLARFGIEWSELAYEDYPADAQAFMRMLWPEFVRVVNQEQGEIVEECATTG